MTKREVLQLLKKYDDSMPIIIQTNDGDEFEDFTIDAGYDSIVLKQF